MSDKIQVLIVDDSAVIRKVLTDLFLGDPDIEVMGAVADPIFAMKRMEKSWPDVIILDIDMPRMDGITFLKKIMSERPTPVIICSAQTGEGSGTTMEALSFGAVEVLNKPKLGVKQFIQEERHNFIYVIKAAAKADVKKLNVRSSGTINTPGIVSGVKANRAPIERKPVAQKLTADVIMSKATGTHSVAGMEKVIAIGASTGGTQALEAVLTQLPNTLPGILVVQHMPEKFTGAFANRLNGICAVEVKEAENGDLVLQGRVLIAPGGRHMALKRNGNQFQVDVIDGPLVNRHRPSVDVLFRSVAKYAGCNAMAIIMTGMGDDGAKGLKEVHDTGAYTVAQNEETCVVYGMPKEAVKLGGADSVIGLFDIAAEIQLFAANKNLAKGGDIKRHA